MTGSLTQLSQSSLQDYVDCPRRFQLRFIDRLNYPSEESEPALEYERHLREGEEFHRMVHRHLIGLMPEQLEKHAESETMRRWWENYVSGTGLETIRKAQSLYPENQLSVPIESIRLVAKYDLISLDRDGRFIIFDWKTYRKRPRNELMATRLQTRVYRALLTKAGAYLQGGQPIKTDQIEMVYWYANFPSDPAHFPYSESQFERDWSYLVGLVREIIAAVNFPLTNDQSRCSFCPYRSLCNRGVKAGNVDELEKELDLADISLENTEEIEF